ncbi:MAG: [ribosomal protein S5]-alanine N-acetyltransferase [Gaiellaceae bacterium]|nr:[ribosomal protein S5]-alanine N-acetyltransferase [Gaiellaceae bacterium]
MELFEELTDGVVTLRPWSMDDLPALVEGCNDETLHHWLPMIPFPYTEEDGREFISGQPERNAEGAGNVGVFDAQTGALLGGCGFRTLEAGRTEFGYWVASAERGRGIAPRALTLLGRWVVENTGAKRLQLHADVENIASQRVAEKAGFTREGVQRGWLEIRGERRDMVSYSLLAEEIG